MPPPPSPPPGWNSGDARPPGYQPYSGQWGASVATREHPNGTTILVLGILSLVVCGLLGPFAWSMGNKALREIDADPGVTYSNRGNVTAGRICGIVGTVFVLLGVVGFVLVLVLAAASST